MYLKCFRKVQRLYRRYHFSIIRLNSSLEWQLSKHRQRGLDRKSTSFHVQLLSLLMQVFSKTPKICSCKKPTKSCWGLFSNLALGFCTMQPHAHTVQELLSQHSDVSQRSFPELVQITEIPENPQKGPCFPIFSWVSCSPAAGTTIPLVPDSCSFSSSVLSTAQIRRSRRHAQQK